MITIKPPEHIYSDIAALVEQAIQERPKEKPTRGQLMFMRLIDGKDKSKENNADHYTFNVNDPSDINKSKIWDDLSYTNPLAIVKYNDVTIAMVHHSIKDKMYRSKLVNFNVHKAINYNSANIKPKEIGEIVEQIAVIKRAKWAKQILKQSIEVTVTNIKVDF